jgi:putative Mn2+ efflux pump MntP
MNIGNNKYRIGDTISILYQNDNYNIIKLYVINIFVINIILILIGLWMIYNSFNNSFNNNNNNNNSNINSTNNITTINYE